MVWVNLDSGVYHYEGSPGASLCFTNLAGDYAGCLSIANYELRCMTVTRRLSYGITTHEAKVKLVEAGALWSERLE